MNGDHIPCLRPGGRDLAAIAIDHARLSYHYLNIGDIDGYESLFEEQAVLHSPGFRPAYGRSELARRAFTHRDGDHHRHILTAVFGTGSRIAAVGRLLITTDPFTDPPRAVEFMDLFLVSSHALLVERRMFFHLPPPACFDEIRKD